MSEQDFEFRVAYFGELEGFTKAMVILKNTEEGDHPVCIYDDAVINGADVYHSIKRHRDLERIKSCKGLTLEDAIESLRKTIDEKIITTKLKEEETKKEIEKEKRNTYESKLAKTDETIRRLIDETLESYKDHKRKKKG